MFNLESGFTPNDMDTELQILLDNINKKENTNVTMDEFRNTSNYVIAYMLAQRLIELQQSCSSIYDYYTQYIATLNEKIKNPISNINGIIEYFANNGYNLSFKNTIDPAHNYRAVHAILDPIAETGGQLTAEDVANIFTNLTEISRSAGNIWLAIERSDGENWKENIDSPTVAQLILDVIDIGNIQWGSKEQSIIVNNGQNLTMKWVLPTYENLKIMVRLTYSNSFKGTKIDDRDLKELIVKNVAEYCKLGMDFEPQRILEIERDGLIYCSEINLQWTTIENPEETDWISEVKHNTYDIKEIVTADNIKILS